MNKVQYHGELCERIKRLYADKNHDYGDSVNDTFNRFGVDAFLVRMYDKINRVYSLTRKDVNARVDDEKIEDTLLDLANYALIALTEIENKRAKEKDMCISADEESECNRIIAQAIYKKQNGEGRHAKI